MPKAVVMMPCDGVTRSHMPRSSSRGHKHPKVSSIIYVSDINYAHDKKVSFFIAQYPGLRTAQSAFTLYFPGRRVQSNTISTSLGSMQPHATINVRKAARKHSHHCL